jgi:hypothetical protein
MPLPIFRLCRRVFGKGLARRAAHENSTAGAPEHAFNVRGVETFYILVEKWRAVILFERILTRLVQIDSRRDAEAFLDEAMGQAADSTEKVNYTASLHRSCSAVWIKAFQNDFRYMEGTSFLLCSHWNCQPFSVRAPVTPLFPNLRQDENYS